MNLKYLLNKWIQKYIPNIFIYRLSINSKLVKYGDLFFSTLGFTTDGRKFIYESINNGALCVISETSFINEHGNIIYCMKIPIIFFYNLKKYLSYISNTYYKNPSNNLNFIGVTGTNGKTTISFIISQWMNLLGIKNGIITTLGNGTINNLSLTNNTTESALEMQKIIYKFKLLGFKNIISEISSHSILQHRVKSITFKSVILTNITHDHLDYHKNFKNYINTKLSFFTSHKVNKSIINNDDYIIKNNIYKFYNPYLVSLKKKKIIFKNDYIYIYNIIYCYNKTYIFLLYMKKIFKLKVNFICDFNIENLLLSITNMLYLGFSLQDLSKTSKKLFLPKGRMKIFNLKNNKVIIDYAHTPDAMKKVLENINKLYKLRIWTIFGCGGNKDYKKRKIMGNISEIYSYKIILTNDNPRYENPINIIKNIMSGILNKKKILVILNRKKAINYALNNILNKDIVVIFGKGHEEYQIFKNKKFYFSDLHTLKKIIK